MRYTLLSATAAALMLPFSAAAEYPEQPVEFIVPFPPGDIEDVLTRLIADEFQKEYGVAAAVVNKPGGGGGPFPGAAEVATAPADGSQIGSFVMDVPLVGPEVGIPALSPNPFEPVGIFATYPFVIAASKDAEYSTMQELADYAQDNELALGHFGNFLIPTQVTFALAEEMGFEWAFETAFDAIDCNTLASGDVDVINVTIQTLRPCLDDVKVLASIGTERIPLVPDTPAVGEFAPTLGIALWNGLFVHKDTPQDVRDKIAAVAQTALKSEGAKELSEQTGALIYWEDAEASQAHIEADAETLAKIAEMIGDN